ncbi:MAG: InlB B-repeat-containing protein [Clostridiales bacterium]|nr:InlB B-repeat-containing protein [Clostridiales bacterium]
MKKTSRAILATLMAAMLSTSALGLAACKGGKGDGASNTVTFDANGGAWADNVTTKTATFDGEGKIAASDFPANPTRADYTFAGWYANADGTGTAYTVASSFSGGTTVYAKWTENNTSTGDTTYTITLNPGGGAWTDNTEGSKTATTGTDGKLSSLPGANDMMKANYKFNGWYTAATGGSEVTTGTVFASDDTIYAQWVVDAPEGDTYTVTFKVNGGKWADGTVADIPVTTGTDGKIAISEFPTDPTKDDYRFDGWYDNADGTGDPLNANSTFETDTPVYAKWVKVKFMIALDANEGTFADDVTEIKTESDGTIAILPDDPTRAGYNFAGWYTAKVNGKRVTAATVFEADGTIYAGWEDENTTVTLAPEDQDIHLSIKAPSYEIVPVVTPANDFGFSYELEKGGVVNIVDGVLTAVAPGTTNVTVKTAGGKSAVATVTVDDEYFLVGSLSADPGVSWDIGMANANPDYVFVKQSASAGTEIYKLVDVTLNKYDKFKVVFSSMDGSWTGALGGGAIADGNSQFVSGWGDTDISIINSGVYTITLTVTGSSKKLSFLQTENLPDPTVSKIEACICGEFNSWNGAFTAEATEQDGNWVVAFYGVTITAAGNFQFRYSINGGDTQYLDKRVGNKDNFSKVDGLEGYSGSDGDYKFTAAGTYNFTLTFSLGGEVVSVVAVRSGD